MGESRGLTGKHEWVLEPLHNSFLFKGSKQLRSHNFGWTREITELEVLLSLVNEGLEDRKKAISSKSSYNLSQKTWSLIKF